jgi:membrane fusion protein (multidrug efflux system)
LIGGLIYWLYARQFESTDDALWTGYCPVSPQVSAIVIKVHVVSNQFVHKGESLIDLDATGICR